jgi:uncharacterized protein (DUF362 family)
VGLDPTRRLILKALIGAPASGVFLRRAGAGSSPAGPPTSIPGPPPSPASAPVRPIVARARRDGLLGDKATLDAARLDDALGAAVARAAGEGSPVAALRRLFRPTDVVGLKLNCLAGRGLSPSPQLVKRLCDWLQEAGLPARSIVVFDRSDRELEMAGFPITREGSGVHCFGINNDFDWTPREWGPGGSCFARLLVNDLTALISVGVLKDHDLAGVSIGMKNWYGVIHNPNKHHAEGCAPYIPHLLAYPLIHDKLRLTVVDASTAQCQSGPARNPRWTWPYQTVLASADPVAVDAVGWHAIEARRREVGLPTLAADKREPVWLAAAAKLGLGEADPARLTIAEV